MSLKDIFHRRPALQEWEEAIHYSNLEEIGALLARGADINQLDRYDDTALDRAIMDGKADMVRFLIDNGADLHIRNRFWRTVPLELARRWQDGLKERGSLRPDSAYTKIVQLLEAAEKDLAEKQQAETDDVLSLAIESGDCDRVRGLFNNDFWAGQKASVSWEQLKIAVLRADEPMMRLLITWDARAPNDPAQVEGIEKEKYDRYLKILRQAGLPMPVVTVTEKTEEVRGKAGLTQKKEQEVKPVAEPEIGDKMEDDTIYAGVSPDTGEKMYAAPADEPFMLSFRQARKCAEEKSRSTGKAYRVPSLSELNVLFNNCARIGGFNLTGADPASWYWSSTRCLVGGGRIQRFGDGMQWDRFKVCHVSVRLVRS